MSFKKNDISPVPKPVKPIEQILSDLVQIRSGEWSKYAFSRDPIVRKISDAAKLQYMEKAEECGREYARKMSDLYGTGNPEKIALKMGMEVSYPELPKSRVRILFAEFRAPKTIRVYTDTIAKCAPFLSRKEVAEILTPRLNIRHLLLAHELFHAVEDKYRKEIYTKTERIRLWKFGPLHNDSPILALGEIAAMSFARELTHLPYSPYVLDVFLVYGYYPAEATDLYEEIMELCGRTPGSSAN